MSTLKEIFPEVRHGIVDRAKDSLFIMHGWPSVCKDDRGVLYAAASGFRMEHVCPGGKNCMYVSFDGGENWTPPVVVNDSYIDDRDTGILYMGGGKMLMSWFSQCNCENYLESQKWEWMDQPRKSMYKGMAEALMSMDKEKIKGGSYVKLSDNYGVTWSENIRVPVTAPHGPAIMSDGTIMYLGRAQDGDCGEDEHKIIAFASTDGGHTWEKRGIVPQIEGLVTDHVHEPHVVQLPSGRLLGALRVHCRPAPMDPVDTCYTTYSDDGGITWSYPKETGVWGLPPHLMVHSSGAVILSYARRGGKGNSQERAAVSYDGGETWTEDYVVYPDVQSVDLGYPATVELDDGSLLTVYYQCYEGDILSSVLWTKWKLNEK